MVITQTPFRISFFGGGTDIPEFYKKNGGAVISATIDKYCYVNVKHLSPFFDYNNEVVYSKIEKVKDISDIEHPAVREAMKFMDMHDLRITYEADLPARSGLGTSSSFAVGMLSAFYALKGKFAGKRQLADDAIYLERILCNEAGGVQDQIAASFGGLNRILFTADGYTVEPIVVSKNRRQELNRRLMLFFTGFSRLSASIQKDTMKAIQSKEKNLLEMKQLVFEAERIITSDSSLNDFGRLMDCTWKLKRDLTSKVSTNMIDEIYEKAKKAGATGGKLLGAGGGGFLLFYVEEENQFKVKEVLSDLMYVPFNFENKGSNVIYFEQE